MRSTVTRGIFDRLFAGFPSGDAAHDALVSKGFAEPVRVISSIAEKPRGGWQTAYQSSGTSVVTDLTGRHEEPDRSPSRISDRMQLCSHPALRSPDQATTPPFIDRRLEAVRCALR